MGHTLLVGMPGPTAEYGGGGRGKESGRAGPGKRGDGFSQLGGQGFADDNDGSGVDETRVSYARRQEAAAAAVAWRQACGVKGPGIMDGTRFELWGDAVLAVLAVPAAPLPAGQAGCCSEGSFGEGSFGGGGRLPRTSPASSTRRGAWCCGSAAT